MIVEFTGLPGSGKSTLLAELAAGLRGQGIAVQHLRPSPRSGVAAQAKGLARRLAIALSHLGLTTAVVGAALRRPRPLAQRVAVIRFFLVTLELMADARRTPPGSVSLIDEGLVQRGFMLFVDASGVAPTATAVQLARRFPPSDVIVHVTVTPEASLARLSQRDRGLPPRLADLPIDVQVDRIRTGDDLVGAMAQEVCALHPGTRVITIDGASDGNVDRILAAVTQADLAR